MKKIIALVLVLVFAVSFVGCKKEDAHNHDHDHNQEIASNTAPVTKGIEKAPAFSYDEEKATYTEETARLQTKDFKNTEKTTVTTVEEAVKLARKECSIESDSVNMFYDAKTQMCKVVFYTEGVAGKDQTVYFDKDGKTVLIVFGE